MKSILITMIMFSMILPVYAIPADEEPSQEQKDQALTDVNQKLTETREVPHFKNGKFQGYRKFKRKPGQKNRLHRLELRDSETITAPDTNEIPAAELQAQ